MGRAGERDFGPYRLVQQLAVGGMAEIHLAKTTGIAGFEKYVVLKMIHPNFSQDHQFIQMLIDEAKITVQLQHVNIAQTFDLGRVGDTFYITMEYVDGADLYKLLCKNADLDLPIPIPVAAFIGKEVASGLDYAHRKRDHNGTPLCIVHRDVSPQNTLISYAGEVKLVDFGIAKATMRPRQTAAGVIKGKYYYMSPEQAWGEPLDHRTDIFSAGILLYETLTGQMLYLEDDLYKLLDRVRRADIPPPSTLRAEIPPELDRIVMRALAKRREERYGSAAELAIDLERFLHTHSVVYTANKVAAWISEILGPAAAPTLLAQSENPEPEPSRGQTRRLHRDQLVRARSEFTDENSIIFALGAGASPGTGSPDAAEQSGTFVPPALGQADEPEVDSLPVPPPPGQDPARRPPSAAPVATRQVVPATGSPPAPVESPSHVALAHRVRGFADAGPAARSPARGQQESDSRVTVPHPGPRGRDQDTRLLGRSAPPEPTPRVPAAEPLPAQPPGGSGLTMPAGRRALSNRRAQDSSTGASPDDATTVSEAPTTVSEEPTWWSVPGDPTPLAEPFSDGSVVVPSAPGEVDLEAPTRRGSAVMPSAPDEVDLEAPTRRGSAVMPSAPDEVDLEAPTLLAEARDQVPRSDSWEPAPALAATVPQPAISKLRPARRSRRTPAGGAPTALARHPRRPGQATPEPQDGTPGSVLTSLLSPGRPRPVHAVLSPPTPLAGQQPMKAETGPPRLLPLPPPQHGPPPPVPLSLAPLLAAGFPDAGVRATNDFSTRAMAAALERDEIPDKYKIRRHVQPTPWLIALFALALSASVAGILLAIYGTGGNDGSGGNAVLRIVTIPPGATVTVDGRVLAERTPTVIKGVPGERFLFVFELPRYQREEQEFLVPEQGDEHQVVARLDPMVVRLTIESQPSGAEVFIGGNSVGRTPLQLPGLDAQSTTSVELRLKGYRPVRQPIDWSQKTEQRLVIQLIP